MNLSRFYHKKAFHVESNLANVSSFSLPFAWKCDTFQHNARKEKRTSANPHLCANSRHSNNFKNSIFPSLPLKNLNLFCRKF